MATIVDQFNKAFFNNQWKEVVRLRDEVHSILQATNSIAGEAVFFVNLGIAYRNLGDINKAIECQNSALNIYKSLGNENGAGYCYTNLGNAFQALGMFKKALEFHEKAIAIAARIGDEKLLLISIDNKTHVEKIEAAGIMTVVNGNKEIRFTSDNNLFDSRNRSKIFNKDARYKLSNLLKRNKIFISYSHRDNHIVDPLVNTLLNKGISIYFDSRDKPTNDVHSLMVGLSEGLSQCHAMLVCFSENYFNSVWCRSELEAFIHYTVNDSGSPNPPILILDMDGYLSDIKLIEICFESQASKKKENTDTQDSKLLKISSNIRKKTEEIIVKNKLQPDQVIQSLWKTTFIGIHMEDQVEKITEKLAEVSNKWIKTYNSLKLTFTDQEDFDLIWHQAFGDEDLPKAGTDRDNIMKSLVSSISKPEEVPLFNDARELWNYIFSLYKHSTVAKNIDINEVLKNYVALKQFDKSIQARIERYFDLNLFEMLKGIADKKHSIAFFDRASTESTWYYRIWIELIESQKKQLEPRILRGNPLHLIFGEAQRRKLLIPLQYTYYQFLKESTQSELVDSVVFACLLVNIDMWFEVLKDKKDFNELIIKPLSVGKDIRAIFPG